MINLIDVFYNTVLPIALTSLFAYFVWVMQRRSKATPLETLINEIQEERNGLKQDKKDWEEKLTKTNQKLEDTEQKLKVALGTIEEFDKREKTFLTRISNLEIDAKQHEVQRQGWTVKETNLMGRINELTDKILDLTRKYEILKRSQVDLERQTGKLVEQTGELKKQTRQLIEKKE